MQENPFDTQIEWFLNALIQPEGVIGMVGIGILLIAMLANKQAKWGVLALMIYASSINFYALGLTSRPAPLAPPLEQLRSYGRAITTGLLLALLLPTLLSSRGWRIRSVGRPVLALFIFELVLGLRIATGGLATRGALSMLLYSLIFATLGVGLGRWLQELRDARSAVRAIVTCGLVFVVATCYQLLRNPAAIIHNHRLFSITGNPQHAAMVLAVTLPPTCYLITRMGEAKIWRLFLVAACGFMVILEIWTGSRTGYLTAAVGVLLLFRARFGKLLLSGLVVGVFVMLALQIYTESTETLEAVFTRGDTRTLSWQAMIEAFRQYPLTGALSDVTFGFGENSYLATAANMGLVGVIPLLAFLGLTFWDLIKLQRIRKYLGPDVMLADVVTAGMGALLVGGMFEGYLLATLTEPILCLYLYLGVMEFLLQFVQAQRDQAAAQQLAQEYGEADDQMSETAAPPEFAPQGFGE